MSRLALALAFLSSPALGRSPQPQIHEVNASLNVVMARDANAALAHLQYTLTPAALERRDEVAPELRRFVRHPSTLWIRAFRDGSKEQRTSLHLGGMGYIADRIYGAAEIGLELNSNKVDDFEGNHEDAYVAAPMRLEVGGRPLALASAGVYAGYRPVVDAMTDVAVPALATERAGSEKELGITLAFATPKDRLLAAAFLGTHRSDWVFTGYLQGDVEIRGYGGGLRLSLQTSPRMSWWISGEARLDDWNNRRLPPQTENGAFDKEPEQSEADVFSVVSDLGLTYWHRGRVGFRVSIGGGYKDAEPVYGSVDQGFGRFGFAVTSRF